jgi:exodeoxyribonuclease VII large subunit
VTAALRELDEIADVEVIVIARGGGAVEDLLPFSNESLVRAVAQAHTPIVSAIGHERDTPLLDFVADVRASTPTDAAKRIVPHVAEERAGIAQTLARARAAVNARIQREQHGLDMMRSRPALAQPTVLIDAHEDRLRQLIARSRTVFERSLLDQSARIRELTTHVRALSPLTTLERGYAVIQSENGSVITSPEQALGGATVHVRVQRGAFSATVNPPHSLPLLNGAEPHPTELS